MVESVGVGATVGSVGVGLGSVGGPSHSGQSALLLGAGVIVDPLGVGVTVEPLGATVVLVGAPSVGQHVNFFNKKSSYLGPVYVTDVEPGAK